MASRSIKTLRPHTAERAKQFLQECDRENLDVLLYCTLRSLPEQAILYRQSRPTATILKTAARLRNDYHNPRMADILLAVGPHSGPHVTNAAPGQSLHNYGLAFDCVPMVGGKIVWSVDKNRDLYELMGAIGEACGLEWAGRWTGFREYVHFQEPDSNWRDLIKG